MNRRDVLEQRLRELESIIRETEQRIPAHSVKPPVMMELFGYEDEYERIVAELDLLKEKDDSGKQDRGVPV